MIILFLHGWNSVPGGATLIQVGNDHRLADSEPLAAMLRACENR